MTTFTAKSILLVKPVQSGVPESSDFLFEESIVKLDDLPEGGAIVQLLCISADPYLRSLMKDSSSFRNRIIRGFVSGKVLASKNPNWVAGDLIGSNLPFTTIQIVSSNELGNDVSRKLTGLLTEENISYGIGILGMPGSTAYGGLIHVLRPKKDETLFISAASGAVGGLVGMLAKALYGCKVIGSCGGDEKCEILKNFYGFDHAIDYKKAHDDKDELVKMIQEHAPDGIDMYFENVGGVHYEAALQLLKTHGRIAVCGAISEYNKEKPENLHVPLWPCIYKRLRIEGFISTDFLSVDKSDFLKDMHKWLFVEKKVKALETFFDGIENWPLAFQSLFSGKNIGKVVVRV
jgi:NADPH-dependent curcumin reductase CurA